MQERTPAIDPATWEVLLDAYLIIAAADNGNGHIERNDLTYIHAKLEDVLKFNSMPVIEPRSDPKLLDKLKEVARKFVP